MNACRSSASLRSSISVEVPTQPSCVVGSARPRNQRYVPSARRIRYSASSGVRVRRASSQAVAGARPHRPGGRSPAQATALSRSQPRQFVPALVPVGDHAVRVRRPDDLRHRVGERAVAHLALALDRGELLLGEERVSPPDLDRLLPELDEDGDLRPQHQRVERLHQVVDGARAVAAEDVLGVLRDRRQEEDRHVPRPLPLLDQLRGLEAVHARHLDVEQDRRELLVEQAPQRLLARRGADEVGVERLQDRLQGEQVLRPVVDEQQLRPVGHREHSP